MRWPAAACLFAVLALTGCGRENGVLVLLATTSTQDTGLIQVLAAAFEARSGYRVKVIVGGSGDVLEQAARGEGDVVLCHSPEAEMEWMKHGHGLSRDLVMFSDFVIVGPAADPAGVRGKPPVQALELIAHHRAGFVSRGDRSGTHVRELDLWRRAGIEPQGQPWYVQSGQGQGLTLDIAQQQERYTLTDRGTFLKLQPRLALAVLVENDAGLINPYHLLRVDPSRHPRVNAAAASSFAEFVLGRNGQELIGQFGSELFGPPLFTPAAGMAEKDLLRTTGTARSKQAQVGPWSDLTSGLAGAAELLVRGDAETWSVIRQSLLISLTATGLSLLIGLPLGAGLALASFPGRKLLLTACNTGFGLPPVVVGLILSVLLLRHGPLGFLNLRFTPAAMIAAQFLLCLPIVAGLTAAALQQLNPRLRIQVAALGASRPQMLRVLLREARVPLLAAYMAAFGSIVSEVGASLMVGGNLPGSTRVLTTAIVMETGMGHYDRALAYGFILLLIVGLIVGLLTWLQQREARA